MPESQRRRERGQRNGPPPALGHGPGLVGPSLPRLLPPPGSASTARHRPLPLSRDDLPPLEPEFWSTVEDGLAALRLELSPGARDAIDGHARLLGAWNRSINLTALRDARQVAAGHVLDSLSAVPALRRLGVRDLLDLGSGGGYPGLPLAAALPLRRCALVDSVRKKAAFLSVAADAVGDALAGAGEAPPSLQVYAERAEDMARDPRHRQRWQCVVARAVGSLAEVAELALPLLRVGGQLVAWKRDAAGGGLERELEAARGVFEAAGGRLVGVEPAGRGVDPSLAEHVLVIVRKQRATPTRFPRPPADRRRALLT